VRPQIWDVLTPIATAILIIAGAFLIYFGMLTADVHWDGVNGGGFYYETDWRFVIPGTMMVVSAVSIIILFAGRRRRESESAR
jgi:hypothetical protein